MKKIISIIILNLTHLILSAQSNYGKIEGTLLDKDGLPIPSVYYQIFPDSIKKTTNFEGQFSESLPFGKHKFKFQMIGFETLEIEVDISNEVVLKQKFILKENVNTLKEVVITATMKEVSKLDSPVPVEVYTEKFFKANPTPSIFESLQNINGVRPQLNCNVCNTGDIHINGLEGPYTMILIDGMPIVSGLSTVYGLTGIPQSLIERVEIVKGPASTLYGSEAVGGLINIITKKPSHAPRFSADVFGTSWGEINTDIGVMLPTSKKSQTLLGTNYFVYQNPIDNNHDGFTDVTLQNRISLFTKTSFDRTENREFSIAGRYVYEDRWGGQMNWSKPFRGGDSIYGESIYTNRWEFLSTYRLPTKEDIRLQISSNGHYQNSAYGTTLFQATQLIGFGQLVWHKTLFTKHELLAGAAYRYTYYEDNTAATAYGASKISLPGLFLQDEFKINSKNTLLAGVRYDYNSIHGNVFTPRLNYKWNSENKNNTVRLSIGNGYRVANIYTEDHAALTGARQVILTEKLKPETSWNTNLNYVKTIHLQSNTSINLDATAFYTYFTNRIIADYDTDPNKIIYDNLNGYSVSKGISLNADLVFSNGLKMLLGTTIMDVSYTENNISTRQLLTERYTGVWSISYPITKFKLKIDYTGNLYGPMRLPLLSESDPRAEYSKPWSIQNIQITKMFKKGWEIFGGVKNLLNFTPAANSIARSFDPFDKKVEFDAQGNVIATPENPNRLSFDPTYVYAPNQGIRGFIGFRYSFR